MDSVTEKYEIEAREYKHHPENALEDSLFRPRKDENGERRNKDECNQDGQKVFPDDEAVIFRHDDDNGRDCQKPRKCGCLAVGGHQEGQHRHYEDPETEPRRRLYETGDDAEKEYVQGNKPSRRIHISKNSVKFKHSLKNMDIFEYEFTYIRI